MFNTLLFFHSVFRWLVLLSLCYAVFIAARGYVRNAPFSKGDNLVRHWTATIAHIQLVLGVIVYIKSPTVHFFFTNSALAERNPEISFFGVIHSSLMLLAVVLVTIGSAKARRMHTDKEKYRTMLVWFTVTLLLLLIAIPWPFSPLAQRPYLRPL